MYLVLIANLLSTGKLCADCLFEVRSGFNALHKCLVKGLSFLLQASVFETMGR